MTGPDFLDTNVIVYAYDGTDQRKQSIARDLLRKSTAGDGVISVQVLAELAATLLHKISPPAQAKDVLGVLDALSPIRVLVPDREVVRRAVEAAAMYGVHFYDGMIIASAERGGCKKIWSEDLNPGQAYFGTPVENPFIK